MQRGFGRFQRTPKSGTNVATKDVRTAPTRPSMSANVPFETNTKRSFVSIAQGVKSDGSHPPFFKNGVFNTKKDLDLLRESNSGNGSKVPESVNVSCNKGNSDVNVPPSFEHVTKMEKMGSQLFPLPKSSECSTSFSNSRRKDIKDHSIVDEVNRIIEVGGALGYDVKGSLRNLINGIGVSMVGLLNLPIGGKKFTWMNKADIKLSKIDHFLISKDVLVAHPDIHVMILDKLWSNHNPILLHCNKTDFGPTPFRIFHSWFDRSNFEDVVTTAWENLSNGEARSNLAFHIKLKGLKNHLKQCYSIVKVFENLRKSDIITSLCTIEEIIDAGNSTDEYREPHINKLHELDILEK
ncbi:RNA-directed DNA polymerase, eukaryota, reverse transcriptase zinc-binding domain protein [Tanacetum coccineum]